MDIMSPEFADYFAYALIAFMVVGDAVVFHVFSKQRAKLDLSTEEGRARDKKMELLLTLIIVQSFAVAAIVWFIVRPSLQGAVG